MNRPQCSKPSWKAPVARKQRGRSRWLVLSYAAVAATLALSCSTDFAARRAALPTALVELNESFFESLQRGDLEATRALFVATPPLEEFASFVALGHELAESHEIRLRHGTHLASDVPEGVRHALISQLEAGGRFYLVSGAYLERDGHFEIASLDCREVPGDLEAMNRPSLSGKPIGTYVGYGLALMSLGFVAWSLFDCWRQRPRFVFLWLIAMPLCFPGMMVHVASGEWRAVMQLVFMGAGFAQQGPFQPGIVLVGYPMTALIWWIVRSRAAMAQLMTGTATETEDRPSAADDRPEAASL